MGQFTFTINPVGGWILEDMTQPATFNGGIANIGPAGPPGPAGEPGVVDVTAPLSLVDHTLSIDLSGYVLTSGGALTGALTWDNGTTDSAIAADFIGIEDKAGNYAEMLPGSVQVTAASGNTAYLVSTGVNLSNGTSLAKGTFDNGLGGSNGISLNCAVGYELNWQAGRLSSSYNSGTVKVPVIMDSGITLSDPALAITFGDATAQTTAFIPGDYTPTSGLGTAAFASTTDFSPAFDQTLNKADQVQFAKTVITDGASTITLDPYWLGDGISINAQGTNTLKISAVHGITFPDSTTQSSAGITATAAAAAFYPLSSNPAGYVTSSALTPYALISSLGTAAYQPTSYWIQSPTVAATDGQIPAWDAATSKPVWIDNAARTLFITAKNQTGATIPARSVVYISGATGANPLISLARADSETTSATTIGITSAAIANGATGQVVTSGQLTKVDTSAYTEGQGLYLSATVAGGFTTTVPVAPNHGVYMGVVTRAHANQGVIEVTIKNYQELEEMSDVLITGKAAGDVLYRNAGNTLWVNGSPSAAGLLTTAAAAAAYYPLSSNPAGYLTSSALTGYATQTYVNSQGFITSAALAPYLTSATAASTYFAIPTGTTAQYLRGNGTTSTFSTDVIAAVPAASTSTAGKVQLATDAQATAGTSTTVALTPANLVAANNRTGFSRYNNNTWSGATSGTGASTSQSNETKLASAPTSAVGYATIIEGWQTANVGSNINAGFDWSKRIDFVCRYNRQLGTADSNSLFRILIGRSTTGYAAAGDLPARGMGVRCVNGSAMQLQVHNGTTLTNVTSSHTPTTNVTYELRLLSDGAGNVTMFIDGTQVATTSAGPTSTGPSAGNGIAIEAENIGTVSGTKAQVFIGNYQVSIGA